MQRYLIFIVIHLISFSSFSQFKVERIYSAIGLSKSYSGSLASRETNDRHNVNTLIDGVLGASITVDSLARFSIETNFRFLNQPSRENSYREAPVQSQVVQTTVDLTGYTRKRLEYGYQIKGLGIEIVPTYYFVKGKKINLSAGLGVGYFRLYSKQTGLVLFAKEANFETIEFENTNSTFGVIAKLSIGYNVTDRLSCFLNLIYNKVEFKEIVDLDLTIENGQYSEKDQEYLYFLLDRYEMALMGVQLGVSFKLK